MIFSISATIVPLNGYHMPPSNISTTTQPTEMLATYVGHQVAPTIFFHVLPTLVTQLGINCNRVLRFVLTFLIPKLQNQAGTRRMWFSQTIEEKLVSKNAMYLTVNISRVGWNIY